MFDNMGFTYIGPVDGHDLKALDKALARQKPRPNRLSSTFTRSKAKAINRPRTISPAIGMASPRSRSRRAMLNFSILRFMSWSHYFGSLTVEMMTSPSETVSFAPR
jgi:deoxyxylulose-5-phosphate synthase